MPSSETLAKQLMVVMKDVSMALDFDNADRIEDAYKKYLEIVLRVATSLLKTLHADVGHLHVGPEVVKLIQLGQQCMDRAANIIRKKSGGQTAPGPPKSFPSSLEENKDLKSKRQTPSRTSPWELVSPGQRDKMSYSGRSTPEGDILSPVISSSVRLSGKELSGSVTKTQGEMTSTVRRVNKSTREMTPLEVARQQNQQLLSAFRRRQNLTTNKALSTTLSLTIQRKIAENLAIAHAQEAALAKKIAERQARLEEQATKRFHSPIGMSEEEQKQRHIYRRVLELEMEQAWLAELRTRLDNDPTDIGVISDLITSILGCHSHPLTEELEKHQNRILNKLTHLASNKECEVNKIQLVLESDESTAVQSLKALAYSDSNLTSESEQCDQGVISPSLCNIDQSIEIENTSTTVADDERNSDSNSADVTSSASMVGRDTIISNTIIIKSDIRKSLEQNKEVTDYLQNEDQMVKSFTTNVAEEYERYSQENMDDLFDSDDDESENSIPDIHNVTPSLQSENSECKPNEGPAVTDETHHSGLQSESDADSVKPNEGHNMEEIDSKNGHIIENISKKLTSYNEMEKISTLRNEAFHRHLSGITEEIMTSVDTLQVLFVVVFEGLDSPEGKDQCNVLIEEYFFRPLWQHLLTLFRLANEPKEISLARVMRANRGCGPERFSVREELCLLVGETGQSLSVGETGQSPSVGETGQSPYHSAVEELERLCQSDTMMNKLDRLVKASKDVMQCVEVYYRSRETTAPSIGADDLLPVLCYIVVSSGRPQLVSECHAIEKFIHEAYMFGEEGYCLTSFQTAINYLVAQGMEQ